VQRVEAAPWVRRQSSSMIVTQAIFGINVAVFIAMALAGVSITDPTVGELRHWGANFGPLTIGGQWWRLLTCIFVHGGLLHIASNMYGLWILGRVAEPLYGRWTFGIAYLLCGLSGSVASIVWKPVVLSVGASGAVFGVAGALLASFYLGELSLPRSAVMTTVRSLAVVLGINLLFGSVVAHIDNAAHVGGLVMGLLLGALIAKVAPLQEDVPRRVGVLFLGALLVAGGVIWLQRSRAYIGSMNQAQEFLSDGKPKDAIAQLNTVVRQHPDYWPAHLQLARAYTIQHDFAKAETELKRVIELNPRNENAYYFLGYTELEQKHPDQAQQAFAQLLKLYPNSADAHAGMAAVFSFENKYAEALSEYQKTAEINPSYQNVDYDSGLMQGKLGLYDDAIQSFLKQRDNGDDPDNENALAVAYQNKGMTKEVAEAHARAQQFQEQR
jgi:rhomboid protease GluP